MVISRAAKLIVLKLCLFPMALCWWPAAPDLRASSGWAYRGCGIPVSPVGSPLNLFVGLDVGVCIASFQLIWRERTYHRRRGLDEMPKDYGSARAEGCPQFGKERGVRYGGRINAPCPSDELLIRLYLSDLYPFQAPLKLRLP